MAFVYIFPLTVQIIFLYGDGSDDDGSITEVVEFVGTVDAIAIASAISNRENPPRPRLPMHPIRKVADILPAYHRHQYNKDKARRMESPRTTTRRGNSNTRLRVTSSNAQEPHGPVPSMSQLLVLYDPPGDPHDARLRVDLAPIVGLP